MPVYAPDRVLMTTNTAGTGDLTLDGAVAGSRTITQAAADGHFAWGGEVYYVAEDDGVQSEWGRAVIIENAPNDPVLQRTSGTVYGTSAGGTARLDFAGGNATRVFVVTSEAEMLRVQDLAANGGTIAETDRSNTFEGEQRLAAGGAVHGAVEGQAGGLLALKSGSTPADRLILADDGIATPGLARMGANTIHAEEVWANGTLISAGMGQKIAEQVVDSDSPVSAVDFTAGIDDSFSVYEFHFLNVLHDDHLQMRTSQDGGATFNSGASDYYLCDTLGASGSSVSVLTLTDIGAAGAAYVTNGRLLLFSPSDLNVTHFTSTVITRRSGVTGAQVTTRGGHRSANAVVNAIRFLSETGNVSGKIAMFGWNP